MSEPRRTSWEIPNTRFGACARACALLCLLALSLVAVPACHEEPTPKHAAQAANVAEQPLVRVELRSWIVAGRGRHLYAVIDAPEPHEHLSTVVEFWDTTRRDAYTLHGVESDVSARIAKYPRGKRIRPMLVEPDDRLEAVFQITPSAAYELQRDRIFEHRYLLLGPNSTSGLRAAFRAAGLDLPEHVLRGAGILGEFPGVDLHPGAEIPAERWADFGLPEGPEAIEIELTRSAPAG
ncbi:MAG: hypothetical protein EA379_09260 [Phycisphaerales bacterium]|nr:MAG: hypothetical protein EA379_09260 [Phycisphaerales bacterium]